MTREEEIMQEANTRYSVSHPFIDIAKKSFKEAAKWADETMIEKACEWLETELYTTHDNCGYKVTASFNSVDKKKFIEEFRKAMEL